MKLNQEGTTQLFLILSLLVITGIISNVLILSTSHYREINERLDALLCLRKSQYYQSKFISSINTSNKVILINYPLQFSKVPYISQGAKALISALKIKQQVSLVSFYKNIMKIEKCATTSKIKIIGTSPYSLKSKFIFNRNFNETTKVSKNSSSYFYMASKENRRKVPIIFKSKITLKNNTTKEIQVESKEITLDIF
jgi:hypothetical protein